MSLRLKNTDVFVALNAALFVVMCAVVYYDRFLQYRGRGNIHEFFIYAAAILVTITCSWAYLRRFKFRTAMLILVEAGILAHFAGAFVPIDGHRLYDVEFLGVRYDKFVHCLNAFAAASVVAHVFDVLNVRLPTIRSFVLVLVVLGLGSAVETLEYLVVRTVPEAGVGAYDNNMQDLIANMAGGVLFVIVAAVCKRMNCPLTRHCEQS